MRVLIVEDEPPIARILANYVKPVAREIVIATTLAEAMQEIEKVPPFEIVTLDLNLPDSNAQQTLEHIKDLKQKNPDCLLVVVTGMMLKDQESVALEHGADGFMSKLDAVNTGGQSGFMKVFRDIVKSVARQPTRYQRNVALFERLTQRIADYFQNEDENNNSGSVPV